jgi:hypothetical protein
MERTTSNSETFEKLLRIPNVQPSRLVSGIAIVAVACLCFWNDSCRSTEPKNRIDLIGLGAKVESESSNNIALKEIVFSFYQGREAVIDAVLINTASDEIVANPKRMPKDISILGSTTSAVEGFSRIKTAILKENVMGEQPSLSLLPGPSISRCAFSLHTAQTSPMSGG